MHQHIEARERREGPPCYFLDGVPLRDGTEVELRIDYFEYDLTPVSWIRGRFQTGKRGPRLVTADGQTWLTIRATDCVRWPPPARAASIEI
jgi:hypothetical protein